jgi:HD-GYP domain-containing protein (c-di-GMP phosphodiesterase class II)
MMKINLLPQKIIEPVPFELKEEFDALQIKNTLFGIKILAVTGLLYKILEFFVFKTANQFRHIERLWNIRNYVELALIAGSCFFYFPIIKKINKTLLWTLCNLCIAILYIVYAFDVYYISTVSYIPYTVFATVFIFTMIPDLKSKTFVLNILFFLTAVTLILSYKYKFGGGYFESVMEYSLLLGNCVIFTTIVFVTKILLYNGRVRNFANTNKINSLNNELQNYSHNLEDMVNKRTATVVELRNAIMETIADLVERRDDVTGGHVSRTSNYLKIFIGLMFKQGLYHNQIESWDIDQMVLSAQLHDVGKIAIDDSILRKPAKLDKDEFEKMKKHTVFGGEIIKEIQKKTTESEFLNYAYVFAVYHHEKWDGSGYPYGIKGENIPLPARIMAIIDVYDALISERPYKKPFLHEEAIAIITNEKGSHFDPDLTEIFASASKQFASENCTYSDRTNWSKA